MALSTNPVAFHPLGRGGFSKAMAIALLLECLMVGAAAWWLASMHKVAPAQQKAPMQLSLVTLPPPPKPAPPKPKPKVAPPKPKPAPPKPHPKPKPRPVPKPKPKPVPKPKPKPKPKPEPKPVVKPKPKPVPKKVAAKPVVAPQPVKTPPPPRPEPAPRPATSPSEMALFEGKVNAAVQAALHYPPAARMLNRQGRVRVAFDYRDGRVSHIHVVTPSPFALLNRAAVETVRDAHYPPPPQTLSHQQVHMTVWVQFRETNDDY